jgi:hypothetical protein
MDGWAAVYLIDSCGGEGVCVVIGIGLVSGILKEKEEEEEEVEGWMD